MKYRMGLFVIISGFLLFSQCTEKEALEILGYSPPQPSGAAGAPTIDRTNLKSAAGSFLPGYQSGKILSDRITLDWQQTNLGNFMSYRILRGNTVIRTIKDQTVTTVTDSNRFQNTFYNYKIAVLNDKGVAQVDTIRLKTPLFLAPGNLTASVSGNSVTLNWVNQAEPDINFRVYRSTNGVDYQAIGTTGDTNYTDTGLSSGAYFYRVTAFFNQLEETSFSNTATAFIP